jgi:hypothetical protein
MLKVIIAAPALRTFERYDNAGSWAPRSRAVTVAGDAMTTASAGVVVAYVSTSLG